MGKDKISLITVGLGPFTRLLLLKEIPADLCRKSCKSGM